MQDTQILDDLRAMVDEIDMAKISHELAVVQVEKIRLIGQAAAFFDGFDGMTKLHDEFEKVGGDTYKLNHLWDGVSVWRA